MYTENVLIKLFKAIIVIVGIILFVNVLFGKYSIFNYLQQKSKLEILEKEASEKGKIKQNLLKEINLLKDDSRINLDVMEEETIKKLNRIPSGYYIIVQ